MIMGKSVAIQLSTKVDDVETNVTTLPVAQIVSIVCDRGSDGRLVHTINHAGGGVMQSYAVTEAQYKEVLETAFDVRVVMPELEVGEGAEK